MHEVNTISPPIISKKEPIACDAPFAKAAIPFP
jgi:hypothetical protein